VFSLSYIAANPLWGEVGLLGIIGLALILLAMVIVMPAELSKVPFDTGEAETEIAEGLLVEYSGRNLAMFYLADGVKTVALASLMVALFFPWGIAETLSLSGIVADAANIVFYLVKVLLVMVFGVTLIRVGVARLRISQVVSTYWVSITLMALLGLVLLMWDSQVLSIQVW
jgi:formate hydrogenlyase subunit 4